MNESFKEILQQIAVETKLPVGSLYTLSRLNQESLEIFKQIWPTIEVARRRTIVQELLEISEANFEVDFDPVFLLAMGDDDAEVRAVAVKGLWENEHPSLIRPLIHLLKADQAAIVRAAAATALGKFIYLREIEEIEWGEATLAEEALLETIYLGSEDIDVRRRAVEAVGYSGDMRVTKIIESAYFDENDKMKVSAIFAMGRNADARWIPQIITELDSDNAELRFEAARACGELEARDSVKKLGSLIETDPDIEVQEVSIWALGRIGGDQAKLILEACVEGENEAIASAAEDALDELNLFEDTLMLYDFDDDLADDDFIELLEDDLDDFSDFGIVNGNNGKQDYLH